jgi:AcrR family transcriptional regulator
MPYEKITVKAITEGARINRNTFYLHYNCVDDVLAEIQEKHSGEYSAIVSGFDHLKDTGKLVRSFFEYMEAQDDFFKRVTCDSRFDYIRERMQNRVTKQAAESRPLKGLDQSVRNILLTFNNCIVLLYRQWVADGRKIPMEEMIELTTTLLENGMKGFRNK